MGGEQRRAPPLGEAGATVPKGGGEAGRAGESDRWPPVSISARSCGGGAGCGAVRPGVPRRGGGALASGAQALKDRPAPVRVWRGEPERGATAALTTEPGHRSARSRERAQGSARTSARGRGAQALPAPSVPTPLRPFLSPPSSPLQRPRAGRPPCPPAGARSAAAAGAGRAGPGDGAAGPGPGGNGRLRVRPLLGAVADAFHGHHLHVSEGQQEKPLARGSGPPGGRVGGIALWRGLGSGGSGES